MPRPKPSFECHSHYFNGVNFIYPEKYENNNTKIEIICKHGHKYKLSVNNIKNQNKDPKICPHCIKKQKYEEMGVSFTTVKDWAENNNLNICNKKDYYNRWSDTLELKCEKCGTPHVIKSIFYWENKKEDYICLGCEKTIKGIISRNQLLDRNKKLFYKKQENLELLPEYDLKVLPSTLRKNILEQNKWILVEYTSTKKKCKYQCILCGHIKECYPHSLFNGRGMGCDNCRRDNDKQRVIEKLQNILNDSDMYLTDNEFINSTIPMSIKCNKCGEIFSREWLHLNQETIVNCPFCFKSIKRKTQNELYDFVSNIVECKQDYNEAIYPKEIDIFIPSMNIGIEYCGLYWHSNKFIDNMYHKSKYEMCNKNGIRLITIFEDEWKYKKDICKSRIKNILGVIDNKVFARNCECKIIDNKVALNFCKENHIQGKGQSCLSYGLFNNGILVSVMAFSRPSASKRGKNYDYELNRFCSLIDYNVVGGASKILSKFKKDNKGITLVSFCDLRWGNGEVYEKLGFSFDYITKPNYFYFGKDTKYERKHRFSFTKKILIDKYNGDPSLSEEAIALNNNLYRIFDCGHKKYSMIT